MSIIQTFWKNKSLPSNRHLPEINMLSPFLDNQSGIDAHEAEQTKIENSADGTLFERRVDAKKRISDDLPYLGYKTAPCGNPGEMVGSDDEKSDPKHLSGYLPGVESE